jgi:hypothetical protein
MTGHNEETGSRESGVFQKFSATLSIVRQDVIVSFFFHI